MYCTNCGAKAESTFRFCSSCGSLLYAAKVQAPAEQELIFELPPEVVPPAPAADRSTVSPATQHPNVSSSEKMNYFLRHWRGELSLPVSFWVNGFLVNLIAAGIVSFFDKGGLYTSVHPLVAGSAMIGSLLLYPLVIWQLVGCFRSARKTTARTGKQFWPSIVIILVILNLTVTVAEFFDTGVVILKSGLEMVTGNSDFPAAKFRLMNNGTELELSGGIPAGTAIEFERQLKAAPNVQLIHLNSIGGRMADAEQISTLIEAKGLSTYTSKSCESACAFIFLSGKQRLLGEKARLGFHSPSIQGRETFAGVDMADGFRTKMRSKGIDTAFTEKALSTKSEDMWYPETAYLKSSGVVTAIVDPTKFASSSYMKWKTIDEFEVDLLKVPYVKALSDNDPKRFEQFVAPMRAAINDGKPIGEVHAEIRASLINEIIPHYLPRASDQALTAYWSTQIDEFEYLLVHKPQACANMLLPYLAKNPEDISKILPESITNADLAALGAVIKSGAGKVNPVAVNSDLSDADFEHVGRVLMATAPDALDVVTQPETYYAKPAKLCSGFVDFFNAIKTLPAKRQANAFRAVFNSAREANEAI